MNNKTIVSRKFGFAKKLISVAFLLLFCSIVVLPVSSAHATPPIPRISVNGQTSGAVITGTNSTTTLKIGMYANGSTQTADWFLTAYSARCNQYKRMTSNGTWVNWGGEGTYLPASNTAPVANYGLSTIDVFSNGQLGRGEYTFKFRLDFNPNGYFDGANSRAVINVSVDPIFGPITCMPWNLN